MISHKKYDAIKKLTNEDREEILELALERSVEILSEGGEMKCRTCERLKKLGYDELPIDERKNNLNDAVGALATDHKGGAQK